MTVTVHEIHSETDNDTSGGDDFYVRSTMVPFVGSGPKSEMSTFDIHTHDDNHIKPEWKLSSNISGGNDITMYIGLAVWDHDSTWGRTTSTSTLGAVGKTTSTCSFVQRRRNS